jgi:hypothetical protein
MLPPKSGLSLTMEAEIPPKHWYPATRLPRVTTQITRLNTLKLIIRAQKFHKITVFSHFSKC